MDSPQSFPDNNLDDHSDRESTQGEVHTALAQAMRTDPVPLTYDPNYESPPTTPVVEPIRWSPPPKKRRVLYKLEKPAKKWRINIVIKVCEDLWPGDPETKVTVTLMGGDEPVEWEVELQAM